MVDTNFDMSIRGYCGTCWRCWSWLRSGHRVAKLECKFWYLTHFILICCLSYHLPQGIVAQPRVLASSTRPERSSREDGAATLARNLCFVVLYVLSQCMLCLIIAKFASRSTMTADPQQLVLDFQKNDMPWHSSLMVQSDLSSHTTQPQPEVVLTTFKSQNWSG